MNLNTASGGTVTVSEVAFGKDFNEPLVHQVVTAFLAGARQGSKAQKNRAAVAGGGRKPWRQKGTGRARAGTIRSPLWRGGGKTFAAEPRDFSQKVNRKMYRGALRCILSELVRQERLVVVDEFSVDAPKTKAVATKLKDLSISSALIVTRREPLPGGAQSAQGGHPRRQGRGSGQPDRLRESADHRAGSETA